MLWKKDPSGMYTDIFANVKPSSIEVLPGISGIEFNIMLGVQENKKCNEKSTKLRKLGNEKKDMKDWFGAMTYYNRSLRFAENNTENLGLAYANRSICFLQMKMYDKCLIDIDMAIDANYPERLRSKLEEVRAICLKRMKKALPVEKREPTLDFDADENFPGMANVLQLEFSGKFGRHFIAKCDIDVGKVIMVEEAFVTTPVMDKVSNICNTCFKNSTNFFPCSDCTSGLVCSENCAHDVVHRASCGRSSSKDNHLVEFALNSIVQMHPDIENWMKMVEFAIKKNVGEIPQSAVDMSSKYLMFLKLNIWLSEVERLDLMHRAYEVFQIVMKIPTIRSALDTQEKERFMMHLCVQHVYIVFCNSFQTLITGGIFLLRNHLNHSCAPNILCSFYENKSVCITSRRIKEGDQLFISYGDGKFLLKPRSERQKHLYNGFGFQCECEKCSNDNWPISSNVIKSDPEFKCLTEQLHQKKFNFSQTAKCALLKQKCLEILIKYVDLAWCIEFDMVASWFQELSVETLY